MANGRRLTILIELGRVLRDYSDGEPYVRKWVEVLCRDKPKTHRAVALIKRWRLQARPRVRCLTKVPANEGSAVSLTFILIHAIERYQTRYPGTTLRQILGALENAADAFTADEEQPEQEIEAEGIEEQA